MTWWDDYGRFIARMMAFVAIIVGGLWATERYGYDAAADTARANAAAWVWADDHGYEGPIDCDEFWGRGSSKIQCIVRLDLGDTMPAKLFCSTSKCNEELR